MRGMGKGAALSAPVAPVQETPLAAAPQMPQEMAEATAPVEPAPMMQDLPPVDAATKQMAQERIASEAPASARRMPTENMQFAASDYPQLNQVPPAPVRPAQADLDATRTELERDRAAADAAKAKLQSDAAAEPSILDEMKTAPTGTMPAAMPQPAAVPVPSEVRSPVSSLNAPEQTGVIAQLPPPPAPLMAQAEVGAARQMPTEQIALVPPSKEAPIQMDHLPMGNAMASAAPSPTAGIEPIQLRPLANPAPVPDPSFVATPAPQPAYASMAPAAGAFDPMAGAPAFSVARSNVTYAGNGFLPDSRYIYRR